MRETCQTSIGCRVTCLAAITSAPLLPDAKDILVQSSLINASLLGDLPTSGATATKRKRPLGVVTVEDSSTMRRAVEEVRLDDSDSDEATGEATPRKNTKNKKKKKRKGASARDAEEIVEVEESSTRVLTTDEGEGSGDDEETTRKNVLRRKASRKPSKKQRLTQVSSETSSSVKGMSTKVESKSKVETKSKLRKKRKVAQVGNCRSTSGGWVCE